MSNIELPRDAEGQEIPLDTVLLYDENARPYDVCRFNFRPKSGKDGLWTVVFENRIERMASGLYLNAPDTWDKLEEDLDRCIERDSTCMYFSKDGSCRNCTVYDDMSRCNVSAVFEDIKKRIRNLNGENHDC